MQNHQGLTTDQAQKILLRDGPNEIVPTRLESRLEELKKILLDPMGLMLLALAALQGLLGETTDALILLAAYVPVTAVDVLLELRAQRALKAMRSNLTSKAKVLRDGRIVEIPVREIVAGDVLVFEEGQALPADGVVFEAANVRTNESALTGESVPVEKVAGNSFFAGTTLLQGSGLGLIERTGKNTQFGHIATLLEGTESQLSPLQKKVGQLVKKIVVFAVALALLLFVLELVRGHSALQSLIVSLTFAMSAVPEEFPLVFTLYLSFGAWRLSRHGVLIRALPSVEALGNVDVICTDKTGTLTEGKFQLEELFPLNTSYSMEYLWQTALMACEVNVVDAMEVAIKEKAAPHLQQLQGWNLKIDYAFENIGKHMSHVWTTEDGAQERLAMKGSVEGVLEHCQITPEEKRSILAHVENHAGQGKRILGLAAREGTFSGDRQKDERELTFLGLLLFSDPIRNSAREAISICQKSGIEVKMLTGDHPLTAHAVADRTGIIHEHTHLYTGQQLSQMSEAERVLAYQKGAVFSRVAPEQKFEMVQALKKSGKVVAMTGDGINDAPALKLADIGISMGLNATDVARSTAKMILVKNDFRGLVEAVFEGRRIFANLRRSFSYLISFHIPVVLLALVPPLVGWGELLLPIHIVLLELVVHPISAFAFENLPLPQGPLERSLLPRSRLVRSIISGTVLSLIALILFRWKEGAGDLYLGRSLAMMAVFAGNMFFVVLESDFKITRRVLVTEACLLLFAILIFGFKPLAELLRLTF